MIPVVMIRGSVVRTVRFGMTNVDFEVELVQGDTGPVLQLDLVDREYLPLDLTGKAVNFYIRRAGEFLPVNPNNPECAAVSGVVGRVEYRYGPNDLAEPGTYYGDVQLISTVVETAPAAVRLVVRPKNG